MNTLNTAPQPPGDWAVSLRKGVERLPEARLHAYIGAIVGLGVEIREALRATGASVSCDYPTLFPCPEIAVCEPEALFLVCHEMSTRQAVPPFLEGAAHYKNGSFELPETLVTSFGAIHLYRSLAHSTEVEDVMTAVRASAKLELVRPARLHEPPLPIEGNYCMQQPQDPAIYRVKAYQGREFGGGQLIEMPSPYAPSLPSLLLADSICRSYIDRLFAMARAGGRLL